MRLLQNLIGLIACLAAASGPALPATAAPGMTLDQYMALSGPAPSQHIAYGPGPSQYVELFEPAGKGPFPVAVLIHGGCFQKQFEGIRQMRGMAGALAAQGIAVWNVEYRRIEEPEGGFPGTFQDVASAMDLLRARAASDRLDARRVVVVGHSAGAWLALWQAGRARLPAASPLFRPHPFVAHEVVALGWDGDLRRHLDSLEQTCGDKLVQLTGTPTAGRPNVYADTIPFELTPNGGHTVFVAGEFDVLETPAQAKAYAAAVRARGDRAETVVLPNASHFDEPAATSPTWPLVRAVILEALGVRP